MKENSSCFRIPDLEDFWIAHLMLVCLGSRVFFGVFSVLLRTVDELPLTFNLYISCLFACESSKGGDCSVINDGAKSASVTNLQQDESNLPF